MEGKAAPTQQDTSIRTSDAHFSVSIIDDVTICRQEPETSIRKNALTCKQKTVSMIGACAFSFICMGFTFSLTALYVDIIDVFQAPRSQAALVQSLCIGIMFGSGIVCGPFLERFGIRWTLIWGCLSATAGLIGSWFAGSLLHLTISLGVVVGLGNGLLFISSNVVAARSLHLSEQERLALPGVMFAGGAGMLVFPKVLEFLTSEYGVRGCLLISSCAYLNMIVVALVITSPLGIETRKTDPQNSKLHLAKKIRFLKSPRFIVLTTTAVCAFGIQNSFIVAMLDFLQSRAFGQDEGVGWFLVFSAVNTATRLLLAFLMLMTEVKGISVYWCSTVVVAGSLIVLGNLRNYTLICILIVTTAVGSGGTVASFPGTVLEIVGLDSFPIAFGFAEFFIGAANPTGAAISGAMYDQLKSYDLPFTVYGSIGLTVAGLTLLMVWSLPCRSRFRSKVYVLK